MTLQQQVGNRAVQRLLIQRQAEEEEGAKAAEAQVEAGEIKIEPPKIEYYDVTGFSLDEVSSQLHPPDQWYVYDYDYQPKIENEVVNQVDVEVTITLRLPRWTGPGWEQAPDFDRLRWLQTLGAMAPDQDGYQDVTQLPGRWLLGADWEQAPDGVKGEWRAMLGALQTQEQGAIDIARRRATVLQQRLLKQPESEVKAVFDQFIQDLKVEQKTYNGQMEFGQEHKISLGANAMVQ